MAFLKPHPLRSPAPGQFWRAWGCLALGAILTLASAADSKAPMAVAREYQIKAVFLFNFAQFVEWPPAAFPDAKSPLLIGILGDDPFGASLDETLQAETVSGRALVARRYRHANEIDNCHILFISQSEFDRLDQIVIALGQRCILTVSDTNGSAKRGAMISFFTENKRIRLRINAEAAKAAGLTISSKLLRPAEIVTTGNQ